jgi:poly(3-hydroxybutyrate) depolymerase
MIRRLVGRTVLALVFATSAHAEEHVLRDVLVLPRVGTGGRRPVHVDAVEARIVAGTWTPPRAGEAVELPDSTTKTWTEASAGENGWLRDDALRGGYACWTVASPEERVMILEASGHRSVYVNGTPRGGDPYGNGWTRLPVLLRAGSNVLLFHVSRGRVRARLVAPAAPAFLSTREPTMADLIVGEDWPVRGGVVVVNATDAPLDDLVIAAGGSGLPTRETPVPPVPPRSTRKVPFWYGGAMPPDARQCRVRLELSRTVDGTRRVLHATDVSTRVRRPDEHHRRTFISAVDGSVQYYATVPMRAGDDAPERPALFLTLHGAGVEGSGQAAVYRPKTWGHVVAPTNRRAFGFDWEDWGRMDAMEVLAIVQRRLDVDPDRTYLTGHSMGGHGTWQIGVTFPDRFAAIGPSAGWRSFWSYTGAERFEDASPVEVILRRAANASDTVALSRNYLHHAVYILHGDKDDNVPVDQARFMRDHLAGFHEDVGYHEEPGAGHWWGNRCCDWDPMFEFFAARMRPAADAIETIEFHTANPGISSRSRWLAVEQQHRALDFSAATVDLDRGRGAVTAATVNVARLALDLGGAGVAPGTAVAVTLDGQAVGRVTAGDGGAPIAFVRDDEGGTWSVAAEPRPAAAKGPLRYGPFKEAFNHRVVLVYGTAGSPFENDWAFAKARLDAETFWYRGNAAVDVLADTEFDPARETDRSVILYGNAGTNAAWAPLLGASPVQVDEGVVRVGDRVVRGDDLAVLLVRPRPESDVALVGAVTGTGVAGMRLTDRLPYFVSGIGYPDCLVLGPEVLATGSAGVRAAGFFGRDWSIETGQFAWAP